VKRTRNVTASELAECCVCEQRVVLDYLRGKRRAAASRRRMDAGTAAHARLHRDAMCELPTEAGDGRCFVATALWGPTDPRTRALRAWRDRWLLKRSWGPAAMRLYYRLSPWLVGIMAKVPRLRAAIDDVLSAVVRRIIASRE